jgi:hypothetical protein
MSEPAIPPALTPEQWAEQHGFHLEDLVIRPEWRPPGFYESVELIDLEVGDAVVLRRKHFHAVAALLLRDQPFGFMREMAPSDERFALLSVLLTRARLAGVCTEEEYNAARDTVLDLKTAAARIAALLPPTG